MKKIHSFQHYLKLLLSTYKLFFKASPAIATFVALLAPIQAIASVLAINAGQNVINEVTAHKQFWTSIGIWIIATALTQLLPPVATSLQGILTDKLTGFINMNLMKKSKDLQSLSIFDNSTYFDDLQLLIENDSHFLFSSLHPYY